MKAELIQKEAAKLTAGIEDWELEEDLQDAFIEGALWAEKTMIDKACEWLLEWETHQGEDIEVVKQFKQAMESSSSEIPNNCEKGGEE